MKSFFLKVFWFLKFNRHKDDGIDLMTKKIEASFNDKYRNLEISKNVALFHTQILNVVIDSFSENGYKEVPSFLKEIRYFLHYTLNILQDDFYIGHHFFETRMTKIDDYVFSQYRRDPNLKKNIDKLLLLAYSRRFNENPRENLLQYFVFIEEYGIELVQILEDFYKVMKSDDAQLLGVDLKNKYLAEQTKKISSLSENTFNTLMPTKPLFNDEF